VFLARHATTQIPLAVKVIDKNLIARLPERQEEVRLEISILKKISGKHPNLPTLLNLRESKRSLQMTFSYLPQTLDDRVERKSPFTENEARPLLTQIVDGLSFLHSQGCAHLDIKPENILLSQDEKVVMIIDFGLSVFVDEGNPKHTKQCGSFFCISPQLAEGIPYNPKKADAWALGCVVFFMLCGYLPFEATSEDQDSELNDGEIEALFLQIISGQFSFPQNGPSKLARDLVKKLLCVDEDQRLSVEQTKLHPWLHDSSALLEPKRIFEDGPLYAHQQQLYFVEKKNKLEVAALPGRQKC